MKGNTKIAQYFFKKEKICEGLKRFMSKALISIVSNKQNFRISKRHILELNSFALCPARNSELGVKIMN